VSHKLTFWPEGSTLTVEEGKPLLQQLTEQGHILKSSCGGHATCSDCIIKIKGGESNLTPPTFEELRLLGNIFHITKERLACQTKVTGDVVIDISAHAQSKTAGAGSAVVPKGAKTVIRKRESLQETALKSQEKEGEKKEGDWYRHWDKPETKDAARPKHLGGNKRPKPFRATDNDPEGDKE
jgi:ferredoxin